MGHDSRQLHFNLHLTGAGHHEGAWLHPDFDPQKQDDFGYLASLVHTAERGKFDSAFIADFPGPVPGLRHKGPIMHEPITLFSALAVTTKRIGLIATVSTTYYEPFNLARQIGSLDLISGGRAGWNIVTTALASAAPNFGRDP